MNPNQGPILVETSPDPKQPVSAALTAALLEGRTIQTSWLLTKENDEQVMVLLLGIVPTPTKHPVSPLVAVAPILFGFAGLSFLVACLAFAAWLR